MAYICAMNQNFYLEGELEINYLSLLLTGDERLLR